MREILIDAIEVLRLVSLDCREARACSLLRCRSKLFLAMQRNAEGVISKYEAEKRREELSVIHARRSEPSLPEVCRVLGWLERKGQ